MQVSGCRGEVGIAREALHDVDVLAAVHKACGMAGSLPVGKVPFGLAHRGSGILDVHRTRLTRREVFSAVTANRDVREVLLVELRSVSQLSSSRSPGT